VGTVLLHALVMLPLLLDLSLPSHRTPNRSGAGASAVATAQEPVMTVIIINEPSLAERTTVVQPEVVASRGLAPADLPIVVLSPDALPATEIEANSEKDQNSLAPPEAVGDETQHALLYGRYLGQLQARIERAWMRPRTGIGAQRFSCRARIEQDRQGDVVGIKLTECNGGERWQQSLLSAIRTASPLPAPPDASVYADRLWLSFESAGFRIGGSTEGFEPENRDTRAAINQWEVRESFEHFVDRADQSHQSGDNDNTGVIHLTIIGDPPVRTQSEPASVLPPEPPPDIAPPSAAPQ
jgi:hypothetical protein